MSTHEVNSHSLDFEKAAEQAAMDRVMDIHKEKTLKYGFVRFDPLDPSIDKLRENLLYDDDIQIYLNKDRSFLTQRSVSIAFEAAILFSNHDRLVKKIPKEEVFTLLIKEKRLLGIVLLDRAPKNRPFISGGIDLNSSTTQQAVDITVQGMLSTYEAIPQFCVPVYGLSASLYWPKEMTYREVQIFVRDRRSNGT